MNRTEKIVTFTVFLLLFSVVVTGYSPVVMAEQSRINGLTIALDTLRSSDTPQVIVDFMKRYNYNGLRIYMGWCSSFWTGNVNSPMDTRTQNFIDELCRLCSENGFLVVCAVSDQVTPFKTAFPQEIQVGPNGEQNSQGNWVCPTGPNFQTFTKNLIEILVRIMEKYATPRISVDEVVFVTGGRRPTFYSQSMKTAYQQATGKSIPVFTSTSGSYNTEQRQFIEFAKGTIRTFYQIMEATAYEANPDTLFGALVDTYWVYPKTSDDTQPYDYYATVDEIVYEWFYAIQNQNWAGITDGLQRIKTLNPSANHYFIYGTSTMTSATNMRKSVELAMAADYYGVFLYEYAKSKSRPFDVSDIVSNSPAPQPPPPQTQYGTLRFSAWDGENWIAGANLTMTFPDGTMTSALTPYYNTQAPLGSYTVKCVYSNQTADNSPYSFTLTSNEIQSYTFVFGITPPPSPAYAFEDNFDSADFSKWSGTRTSSGETVSVVADQSGYYVRFTSNGEGEVEYAYCYKTINEEEVWASGHFYAASGLPLDNDGDRFYFIRFTSGRSSLASVGIGRHEGSDKWVLYGRNGSGRMDPFYSASPDIEMNRWYCVELHWKKDGTHGVLEALVDSERILSIDIDTASLGNVSQINFGLTRVLRVQKNLDVYGDCFSFMGMLSLTSPIVVSRVPGVGATDVPVTTAVQVTFSGPMDRASTEGAFSISPSVSGSFGWSLDNTMMSFTLASSLAHLTEYTVTITTDAMDQQGENILAPYSWSFTTSDVNVASYVIGDINQDGSVNIGDLYIVGASAGSTPDSSRWNPIADLNKDGVVNIIDLVLVAMNFGS